MFSASGLHVADMIVLGREDIESGEKFVQIFNLKDPFNRIDSKCIPVSAYHKGIDIMNAVQISGDDNVLKRLAVTPDGKEFLPVIFGQTKNVCFAIN